jgi:hypothetical protein
LEDAFFLCGHAMTKKHRLSANLIGGVFLGLGIYKLFFGEGWIVWIILGLVFGGWAAIDGRKSRADNGS